MVGEQARPGTGEALEAEGLLLLWGLARVVRRASRPKHDPQRHVGSVFARARTYSGTATGNTVLARARLPAGRWPRGVLLALPIRVSGCVGEPRFALPIHESGCVGEPECCSMRARIREGIGLILRRAPALGSTVHHGWSGAPIRSIVPRGSAEAWQLVAGYGAGTCARAGGIVGGGDGWRAHYASVATSEGAIGPFGIVGSAGARGRTR